MPGVQTNASRSLTANYPSGTGKKTLRDMVSDTQSGGIDFVGTPDDIAAALDEVMQHVGGHGFLLTEGLSRRGIAEVCEGLAPALRKRGLLRARYDHTLFRKNLLELSELFVLVRVAVPILASFLGLVAPSRAETAIERGRYLATAVAACATCHRPRDPSGPFMSGGRKFGEGDGALLAPNITPDVETGLGGWSDAQIVEAIRDDVRPDGTTIRAPMPQQAFKAISDRDVAAIVAYLRSLPAAHNTVPRAPGDQRAGATRPSSVGRPSDVAGDNGRYLVSGPAHCVECHHLKDGADATAKTFKGPWGTVVAPPLAASLLSNYTDEDLARVVTQGIRPDGSRLVGPMPVTAYAALKAEDLSAIIAFLRR